MSLATSVLLLTAEQVGGGSAPINSVAPAVTGSPTVGRLLSATPGTWTDDGSGVKTYQWQHADDVGFTSGVANATGPSTGATYVPVAGEATKYLRCVVTDTDGVGATSANSNVVGPVAAFVPRIPGYVIS